MSVIKGVNFWSVLFASQMGGWVMAVLDMVYGVLWHIFVMVVSFVGSLGDALWFQKPMQMNAQISTFVLHIVWGGLTGFLYNPPEREE